MAIQLVLALLLTILISCVSDKPAEKIDPLFGDQNQLGIFEAKAQLRDINTNKTQQVDLDFITRWPHEARVNISGPLGVALASLVIQNSQLQYASYRQKAFYEGVASERSLRAIFQLDIDPRILLNLCYDRPILISGWKCESDEKNFIKQCHGPSGIMINWSERNGFRKKVTISNANHEVTLMFKSYVNKHWENFENKKSPFHIEVPSDFKRHQIR